MEKKGYVYFLASESNRYLYIGVTSDLTQRLYQHKYHYFPSSYSSRYKCSKLVYFEEWNCMSQAITREKQLKNWHREWKNNLVNENNPSWKDLSS